MSLVSDVPTKKIQGQFRQGYEWFVSKTGSGLPFPDEVKINPLPESVYTKMFPLDATSYIQTYGKRIVVDVCFSLVSTEVHVDGASFIHEGAESAFLLHTKHVRGTHYSENAGEFAGNLAVRQNTGRVPSHATHGGKQIRTTKDYIQNVYVPVIQRKFGEKLTSMILQNPESAPIFREMLEKDPSYAFIRRYAKANDLIEMLYTGKGPTLADPFLMFLSNDLYDPREDVDKLFEQFMSSRMM